MPPAVKQIKLTEKQIEGFIAAQKDMSPIAGKDSGRDASEQLPPKLQAELEAVAKKHGFKDFAEYDEVVGNITMVMAGIDPKTKAFTEPRSRSRRRSRTSRPTSRSRKQEKKQMLEELNEALKVGAAHSISQQYRAREEVLRQDRRGPDIAGDALSANGQSAIADGFLRNNSSHSGNRACADVELPAGYPPARGRAIAARRVSALCFDALWTACAAPDMPIQAATASDRK